MSTPVKRFKEPLYTLQATPDTTYGEIPAAPHGYPREYTPDKFTTIPDGRSFQQRRAQFLEHVLRNPSPKGVKAVYSELVRAALDRGPIHTGLIEAALEFIETRHDCSDFVLAAFIRLRAQCPSAPLIPKELYQRIEAAIIDFKYHPEEPGIDSMCTWTENHQILFASNQYIAGKLFPERIFTNSLKSGVQQTERARAIALRWLDLRIKTGFSEWLSNVYYDEDITALLNLVDFCNDPELIKKAEKVLNLLFLDMAQGCFYGVFATSHGRSYAREKRFPAVEATSDTMKLAFGMGNYSCEDNMSAVVLALSENYAVPKICQQIAAPPYSQVASSAGRKEDVENGELVKKRMGIRIRDAARWGIDFSNPDDILTLLTFEAYAHHKTISSVIDLFDMYHWWENNFFRPFSRYKGLLKFLKVTRLLPVLAFLGRKDVCRNTREEVNVYSYRTDNFMLSCAQEYRPGYGGDQQHIWQATLSPRAVVFTTHPANRGDRSAGYWVGNGTMPKAVQHKNVLIALYKYSFTPGLYMTNQLDLTHAWFPQDAFDEIFEYGGWTFGRVGGGYIGLFSARETYWAGVGTNMGTNHAGKITPEPQEAPVDENAGRELIAPGNKNVWICECGSQAELGTFSAFINALSASNIKTRLQRGFLDVVYESPSIGTFKMGWLRPPSLNGRKLHTRVYSGYETFLDHFK